MISSIVRTEISATPTTKDWTRKVNVSVLPQNKLYA